MVSASSTEAFIRCSVADHAPLQLAERLKDCPTLKTFSPQWASVEQLQAPGAHELVVFTTAADAADATVALRDLGCKARAVIDQHLHETGALLLQHLPITSPDACEAFVDGLGFTQMPYEPVGPPRQKVGKLDAATNIGAAELLDLHNEMSYNPKPPAKILLICLKEAKEGGESLLGDGASITAAMPEHIMQRFAEKGGIKYTRTYYSTDTLQRMQQQQQQEQQPQPEKRLPQQDSPNGLPATAPDAQQPAKQQQQQLQQQQQPPPRRGPPPMSWQEKTGCSDKTAAASYFEQLGFRVEWVDTPGPDTMLAWHVVPAVTTHPVTRQQLWFNIAHLPFPGTSYADGDVVEKETRDAICQARLSATRALKLHAGDVLVLDNYRYLHGRLPYSGSERVLVAVLTAD